MPETAVTESRTFEVRCRRRITEGCRVWEEINSGDRDEITSISAAEAAFRADGWQLHGDGTASCPECLAVWEGTRGPDPVTEAIAGIAELDDVEEADDE